MGAGAPPAGSSKRICPAKGRVSSAGSRICSKCPRRPCAAKPASAARVSSSGARKSLNSTTRAWRGRRGSVGVAACSGRKPAKGASAVRPIKARGAPKPRTRSPPRRSSAASASNSISERSCLLGSVSRLRQAMPGPRADHKATVCAASHSVSRMNTRSDRADCRQSTRLAASPGK